MSALATHGYAAAQLGDGSAHRSSVPRRRHLVSIPTGDEAVIPAPRAAAVRMTRRGRLVVTLGVATAAVVAGVGVAWGGPAGAASQGREVTVQSGQTLSLIAEQQLPGMPTAEAVTRIQLANDLSSRHIHSGQSLTIPGQ